jgi:hypothetical protein
VKTIFPLLAARLLAPLAAFVRHASELQRHALWQSIGETMARRVVAAGVARRPPQRDFGFAPVSNGTPNQARQLTPPA